jgi:hypothetical protein
MAKKKQLGTTTMAMARKRQPRTMAMAMATRSINRNKKGQP